MTDNFNGTSQNGGNTPSSGMEGNPSQTAPVTAYSDLASARAQRQTPVAGVVSQPNSGQTVPNGQDGNQPQRSDYIPRDRFDEVNSRRIAAEAQLQQYQQMTQQQLQAAAFANSGAHPTPQSVAQSQPVQDFIGSLSSPDEQKKWRDKIINQPVTGIAELIQYALRTEGTSLLQQQFGQLQNTLAPLQQYYQQQQLAAADNYARQRATDPNSGWSAVQPLFTQLVQRAQQQGYALNQTNLQVIESVARSQVGLPAWGQAPQQHAPFTERPAGATGFANVNQQQTVQLTPEQKRVANMLGVDEGTYARNLQAIRGSR